MILCVFVCVCMCVCVCARLCVDIQTRVLLFLLLSSSSSSSLLWLSFLCSHCWTEVQSSWADFKAMDQDFNSKWRTIVLKDNIRRKVIPGLTNRRHYPKVQHSPKSHMQTDELWHLTKNVQTAAGIEIAWCNKSHQSVNENQKDRGLTCLLFGRHVAGTRRKGQSKPRREAQRPRTKMAGLLILVCAFLAIYVFLHSASVRLCMSSVNSAFEPFKAHWSLYVPHSGHYMYHQFNIQQFHVLLT